MSSHFLKLIPTDPCFVPPEPVWSMAAACLDLLTPKADIIETSSSPSVQFVDPGDNFEHVRCPACASDITDWWTNAMDATAINHFTDLSATLPCCGLITSLNDLDYKWPAGFARFTLAARNPNLGRALSLEELDALQTILGCYLRQIFVRI